jgi:starch synthase
VAKAPIKVLSVASEAYPLVKTGGLADVVGALPGALKTNGVEMRTIIPGYPKVLAALRGATEVFALPGLYGGDARVLSGTGGGLDLFVIDAPHLYVRDGGIYGDAAGKDWSDNWMRFGALSLAAARIAEGVVPGWVPDIVHCHDWQAGLVPAHLKYGPAHRTPSIMTVHNLAFQGRYSGDIFPALYLPGQAMGTEGVEYYGGVGYLKAGLQSAWAVTTVSPTYAREIRTPEFGMGLDGLLNARTSSVFGIVNGIDIDVWDPETDKDIAQNFSAKTLKDRAANKALLRERFGLEETAGPLFIVISRLTWQKGLDLLAGVAETIVGLGGSLAVLGSGDPSIEAQLHAAAALHPGKVGVVIGYDEGLSHLMQAGADVILIPSRFEPCGLTQLYALRYGCIPVVARTGGLADTVIDANDAALSLGVATGLQFSPVDAGSLNDVIARATALFADSATWKAMQLTGMKCDVSWERSAKAYASLYQSLLKSKA